MVPWAGCARGIVDVNAFVSYRTCERVDSQKSDRYRACLPFLGGQDKSCGLVRRIGVGSTGRCRELWRATLHPGCSIPAGISVAVHQRIGYGCLQRPCAAMYIANDTVSRYVGPSGPCFQTPMDFPAPRKHGCDGRHWIWDIAGFQETQGEQHVVHFLD